MSKISAAEKAAYKPRFLEYLNTRSDEEARYIGAAEGVFYKSELVDHVERNTPTGIKILEWWIRQQRRRRQGVWPDEIHLRFNL